MAGLSAGTAKLVGNGQPFQVWRVPVILDGTATSASGLAHGITGATSAPDAIITLLDGSTSSAVGSAAVIPVRVNGTTGSATTLFDVQLTAAGVANGTVNLGFVYFNQF